MEKARVLFVCLGNICRSPTAEGVFRSKVQRAGLADRIQIDSAGTGDWHVGRPPDKRAQQFAAQAGYDISDLRGRQVSTQDFRDFDFILAMDQQNLADLHQMKPDGWEGTLALFLSYDKALPLDEVPDPYTMGEPAFRNAIKLIERGSDALLEQIRQQLD